jgi:Sel1 repeat.
MYLNGYYVDKNETEAFRIFVRCLQTMTEEAEGRVAGPLFLRLGKMHLEGLGTEKDLKAALALLSESGVFPFMTW